MKWVLRVLSELSLENYLGILPVRCILVTPEITSNGLLINSYESCNCNFKKIYYFDIMYFQLMSFVLGSLKQSIMKIPNFYKLKWMCGKTMFEMISIISNISPFEFFLGKLLWMLISCNKSRWDLLTLVSRKFYITVALDN